MGFLLFGCENKIEIQNAQEEFGALGVEEKPWYSGYDWGEWDEEIKVGYIIGLAEGLEFSVEGVNYAKENFFKSDKTNIIIFEKYLSSHRLAGVDISQLLDKINIIYKDRTNKNIPIIDVTTLVAKRIKELITEKEFQEKLKTAQSFYK